MSFSPKSLLQAAAVQVLAGGVRASHALKVELVGCGIEVRRENLLKV